ncbi:MAG: phosphoadenosine phosphosulfate reductase family protein [Thermoplasmata archaeon]
MRKSHERKGWLFWCEKCNIPLITEKCGICGGNGTRILLHHGLEIRPGFEDTVRKINNLLYGVYGVKDALSEKLVLLHKIAGVDRAEEIIVDGKLFGIIAYFPEQKRFQISLKGYGAFLLARKGANKNVVIVEETALKRHLKNGWIYANEVREMHEVSGHEEVIILVGKYTAAGVPKFAQNTDLPEKCIKVKDIGKYEVKESTVSLEKMVKGNEIALRNIERKALCEIKDTLSKFAGYDVGISFSGGKDSAVAFHLLHKCLNNFFVLFVDTGLEFQETVEYVKRKTQGKKLYVLRPENSFWDLVEKMGPPAKDYRWCCKVCKLAPVAKFVAEHGQKILCIEGRRKAESFARENIELVEQNPFVPGQVLVNPIRDWSAFHIWLYILWQNLEVNSLYYHDFERIGCYLCPAEHACEFDEVASLHPEMYTRWMDFLKQWAMSHGLTEDFWKKGIWRWKQPPKKMAAKSETTEEIRVKETITCDGEVILNGNFPYLLDSIIEAENALGIIGVTERKYDAVIVRTSKARILLFLNGDFTVVSKDKKEAEKVLVLLAKQMARTKFCTVCGICLRACPVKAIEIRDGKPIYELKKCKKCLQCIESCVAARYYDKRLRIEIEGQSNFPSR